MLADEREAARTPTRADELVAAYGRLAGALAIEPLESELVRELAIRAGWGARSCAAPLLPSGVRHGVPWGLSMVPGARELRVFIEAQADPPSLAAYRASADRVTELAGERGASLARLRAITAAVPSHARVWHAVSLAPDRPPRWHAYVCLPQRSPVRDAAAALEAAGIAIPSANQRGASPRIALRADDRVTIVSLDLVEPARVKAYVLMPEASAAELGALIASAEGDDSPSSAPAMQFARAMLGGERRIWWLVALGFTPGSERAHAAAVHLGVPRHLDEATARERIEALLREHELDPAAWRRAASALGGHHFVSFQLRNGRPRVTAYFVPEVAR